MVIFISLRNDQNILQIFGKAWADAFFLAKADVQYRFRT
ncbi:hypothetical protein P296_17985 [Salmonella enterica subsp. arizonae serovar 18:z4,z23:- str. CVM N26624]|uniref:Uncharacterized protein n=1 Tax=Salmonella enterica subsp. arizonae serovar 18:z4,z23:- str. CVM N26626 TaxID=1395119 RepID=A0A3S5YJ19_SALER|nr:hypothetical protein N898_04600 [Salmonella enterica subsp. arizonae serovar 62:z36:- str. RKS2983]OLV92232.1 hypothetical protein P297_09020 [Salmonella enterica subsp. arizonae serovar 18:z4,z23:- str. CVM N26625]OLV97721.1 hypothetical protein P296_17985 [Salmonella enterica subsp. arizonae serovar 18:z4,z23:- str. CVM N26624]OLV97886.1 hypothetical protein P298_16470 [Salmonella enterica subsp. arizonae serovar 18:z4,z23:- str. CVM N26626]OLW07901.1 hypothetical protein P292_06590 [Salmo